MAEEEEYYGSPAPPLTPSKPSPSKAKSDLVRTKSKLKKVEEDLANSKEETQAVRKKLHNAIRKGKAIEQEKNKQKEEIERLKDKLDALSQEVSNADSGSASPEAAASTATEEVDKWRSEATKHKTKCDELESAILSLRQEKADLESAQGGASESEEELVRLRDEVVQHKKQVRSLNQKAEVEKKLKEANENASKQKVEAKDEEIQRLKQEMAHLQSAMRSAAERAANATVNESRASEEQQQVTSQVKTLQRRVAELEGQVLAAGDHEQEKQRMLNETLNLRTERDELENEKLRLESANRTKQEDLAQVEDQMKVVQEECVRLTQVAAEAKMEAKMEVEETMAEVAKERAAAAAEVEAAKEGEALAAQREEKAVKSMQDLTQSLQTYRLDEEDRKKKFSRLQAQYSAELDAARGEIDRLTQEVAAQQKTISESSSRQAELAAALPGQEEGLVSEEELKTALIAATEPLSKKIDEFRVKAEETEALLKSSRQENMELTASLAQMEVSASTHLKVEESVGQYKSAIGEAEAKEAALEQKVEDVARERDALKRANEELLAGNTVASGSEIKLMREQLEEAQMLKIQAEDATRKVKNLQKENKDLRWQIAMTSTDDSIKVDIPKHLDSSRHLPQPKGPLAFLVKHRKHVAMIYLLLLHFLVYFALTHHSERSHHHTKAQSLTQDHLKAL